MIHKVLITDDHAMLRVGLAQMVRRLLPDCHVIEAGTRLETLSVLRAQPDVDLLLLDLNLPDGQGLRTAEEVLSLRPLLPVALVTSDTDAALARRAMSLGLVGYLPKSTDASLTSNALQMLLSGGTYWPRNALRASPAADVMSHLGERQQAVLEAVCRGLSNKQVAQELRLTEATVKAHLTTVFRVLKVNSRSQAIALVHRLPGRLEAAGD
jgi:DNA-binding NarL/FixJ family response regulator